MTCTKCGKTISDHNSRFCPYCGTAVLQETNKALCKTCGRELRDPDSHFCPYCGSAVQENKKIILVCPECMKEYDTGFLYCELCGRRLQEKQAFIHKAAPVDPRNFASTPPSAPRDTQQVAALPLKLNGVTYYAGEPTLSPSGVVGSLEIQRDKLTFAAVFGGFGKGFLSLGKQSVYAMCDIQNVREGKYGGMWPSIVIEMRDGTKHSFVSAVPGTGTTINRAILTIRQQL